MHVARRFLLFLVALLIIGAGFGVGVYVGYNERPAIEKVTSAYNKEPRKPPEVDFLPFWHVWNLLEEKHVGRSDLDRQGMVYGAISGLVKSLDDPYTVFLPPREKELFESEVSGKFEGIGAEIGMRKSILTIISPLAGSPAKAAGLLAGDKVFKIDDTVTADLSLDEAVDLIRGPQGTTVALTVLRNGEDETRVIEIVRNIIRLPILEMEKREDGIFIIRLFNFSESAPHEFRKVVGEVAKSGASKLVLDLRNNPGGFLEAAVDIASWFLEAGKVVAREDFGEGESEELYRSKGYNVLKDMPVAVLINEGSASASEILAGALRDHKASPLIGKKSFGKGSVQELTRVTDETSVKITIAQWLTPSGVSLHETGLEPDEVVEATFKDIEEGKDPQLERAIEILKGM